VHLIPETLLRTNFKNKNIGDRVNLEPDMKTVIFVEALKDYFFNIDVRLTAIEKNLKFPNQRSNL
jgi:riboflavin synthase alpha subunit